MKICDATQFYSEVGGGVRRYITEKRKYVETCTDDEHLLLVPGERTERIQEGRLTTWTVGAPRIDRSSRYRILFNLKAVSSILHREKPDIIESGDPYQLGWKLIDVGHDLRIPVAGFYHSHFPEAYLRTLLKYAGSALRNLGMEYAREYIRYLYSSFDSTLVPSQFLADLLDKWGVKNTTAVHLGVDTEIFSPGKPIEVSRRKLGLPEDAFLLFYMGRLAGEKNTLVLLETFRHLHRMAPGKFCFLVIGDGALREAVRKAEAELPGFKWISYCNDKRHCADYYRLADLFVHPGVCETFGLVTLESQSCATPVVGIRGTYMDANIFSGLNHWAPENNGFSLAQAILEYPEFDLKAMGEEASREVRSRYRWEQVFDRIWKSYRKTIQIYESKHGRKRELEREEW